jgi:steroid delta-isomerase-like uncharacterized protein
MSTDTNKAIVRHYYEQEDNMHQIPGHNSRDSLKASIGSALEALPDIQITLHDVIAEGNKVVTRSTFTATHQGELMGIPATGKQLTVSGATIFRLDNARITLFWNFNDNLGLMQQLGAFRPPGG